MKSLNQHRYTLVRFLNFIRGVFVSLLFLPVPKIKKRIIFSSSHNRNYNFNSKYLFEYALENFPEFDCRFVINDKKLREELIKEHGNHFITNTKIKDIVYILRSYNWVTSTTETPVMGVLQSVNRNVLYLSHGPIFKNAGLLEKKVSWLKKLYYKIIRFNFTYFLTTSEKLKPYAAIMHGVSEDKIRVTGEPKNDSLIPKNLEKITMGETGKKILYAPTWRKSGEVSLFPFEDYDKDKLQAELEKNNIHIYLKLHPFFEQESVNKYCSENIHLILSKNCKDISRHLSEFDLLISDYSSLFIDFLLLDRPVMFLPYDLSEYLKDNGFVENYEDLTPGYRPENQLDFLSSLALELEEKSKINDAKYLKTKDFFHKYSDQQNCRRVMELIEDAARI